MAGKNNRSAMVQVALVLSMINLMIIVAGIMWVSDAFQEAERDDKDVVETLKARAQVLLGALQGVGGVMALGACVFVIAWLFLFYKRTARRSALHQQSADLNSYLKNLSRARPVTSRDPP